MTTTLTRRLTGLFLSLRRHRRADAPRLEALNLNGHDLADLNLPPEYRARLDILRLAQLGNAR
jgi:hypothetical protein